MSNQSAVDGAETRLRDEVRAIPAPLPHDDSAVLRAISELSQIMKQSIKIQSSDRIIIYDELGAPRSRIVGGK